VKNKYDCLKLRHVGFSYLIKEIDDARNHKCAMWTVRCQYLYWHMLEMWRGSGHSGYVVVFVSVSV
jgi:hypothetical protein